MMNWWKERQKRKLLELQEEIRLDEEAQLGEEAKQNKEGKDSDKPWVTVVGDAVGEEGLQVSLDWNDAFIEYLKANGIEGKDDTQIVQYWLAMIAKQQADRLSEERLELEGKVSDFE